MAKFNSDAPSSSEKQEELQFDAATLIPTLYDELRKLAAHKLSREPSIQSLQATALVHEAYLRITSDSGSDRWANAGHFFAAAAEAMRRILIENARRKRRQKHGGNWSRQELVDSRIAAPEVARDVEALDEALDRLSQVDPEACQLVKLRCFVGVTLNEAAAIMGVSPRTATRLWTFARAWLNDQIGNAE